MKQDHLTRRLVSASLEYTSEVMGLALRDSAYSPNIRERMDHSAAVFTADGRLLAQAEHIPVHLGSLPWGLRNLIARCGKEGLELEEGCMVAANDPYITGTHLNDVTVAAPVHSGGRLVAFVVNKAHHSDVGGVAPGSISMKARTLDEEGLVLEPTYLWRRHDFVRAVVDGLAKTSRSPTERKGDLRAQVAANVAGAKKVRELIDKVGLRTLGLAAEESFERSERMFARRISRFRRGTYSAQDLLEGKHGEDITLRATVRITGAGVEVDYEGTDAQVDYPMNAVLGVTISGAYFVLRALTGSDIPANHGAFRRVKVRAPEGCILNPTSPHPVGAGNVETSQRNADVLFRALSGALHGEVPAAAGGSMNNVMMGGMWRGASWSFYETIGVGLGGGPAMDGMDGIQANMTNTLNTPIEEIEKSFPLLMTRYEFRPDSSGAGRNRGGSGLVRSYECLADGTVFTITADRERHRPWGVDGGLEGAGTRVFLRRRGRLTRRNTKSTMVLRAGDEVEVWTAGGGGYGGPSERPKAKVREDLSNGLITQGEARRDYGDSKLSSTARRKPPGTEK